MTLTKTDREHVIHATDSWGLHLCLGLGHQPSSGGTGAQKNPRRCMASRKSNIALPGVTTGLLDVPRAAMLCKLT